MSQADDAVLYAAQRVRTMDPSRPLAEALVVQGGKVVEVGSREALARAHPMARVVEVPGVIVPGLEDSHAHLSGLGSSFGVVDLFGAASEAEAVALVKAAGPESRRGDWILGRGWDQNRWPGHQFPGRKLLDEAFPGVPVFLTRVDEHAAWVNGEALRRAKVTAKTVDPEGGRFLREGGASREPTGVVVDNAMNVVGAAMPPLTDEQFEARMAAALAQCAAVGLTAVHDTGMDLRTFVLLQQWDAAGRLPLRVYAMADGQGADGDAFLDRGTFRGRMLSMRSVKFLLDGALGSRGAALHEPYSDEPSQSGLLLWDVEKLEARVHAFMERGFQVGIHAIGDRANTLVISLLERESKRVPGNPGRHRVEHAQVLRLEDIPRLARSGLIASMQPIHATSDMPWAEKRLGPERVKGAYAWKRLLDAGAPLAFGSDFPVESPEPLLGLYAARTRQDAGGQPEGGWFPEERLSGEQALAAFTTGAAFASFAEGERGRLAPGMDADFTALSVDPVDAAPAAVRGAKVLATVVGGREVYRAAP
ncbi:MAG TPA: amidohydrolase [Myxococcaceae bacterium]